MQLGNQNLTTGDIRRYQIDYTPFLQPGEVLSTFTLAIAAQLPPATSTVNSAGNSHFDVTETQLFLYVTGGVVNESFTVDVAVTTSYSQTIHDTIAFNVVAA